MKHVCGLQGYGLHPDDRCPACEEAARQYDYRKSIEDPAQVQAIIDEAVGLLREVLPYIDRMTYICEQTRKVEDFIAKHGRGKEDA